MINMNYKEHIKIEELAMLAGVSVKTINYWYMFKKKFPDNEYAQLLPDYIQQGGRQTRYWKREDVWKIITFKQAIPRGRNGVMGEITHEMYQKKERYIDDEEE